MHTPRSSVCSQKQQRLTVQSLIPRKSRSSQKTIRIVKNDSDVLVVDEAEQLGQSSTDFATGSESIMFPRNLHSWADDAGEEEIFRDASRQLTLETNDSPQEIRMYLTPVAPPEHDQDFSVTVDL